MSERWRCFVAVPIGVELRARLRSAVDRWRDREDLAGLRWTDPDGWHLTLAFLGGIPAAEVPRLVEAIESAAAGEVPSRHSTGGIGGFPSASRARVAWYGVADPDRRLRHLARAVRDALALEQDDRFRGHVTLARARSEPVDLRPWATTADAPEGTLSVTAVELMRSHLGRGPARYETLARIALRAGVAEPVSA